MWQWIVTHPGELQALSGISISLLTIILIFLNAIYVRANWKTMRLMEADIRFKLKPIPHIGIATVGTTGYGVQPHFILTIRSEHAPLKLKSFMFDIHLVNGHTRQTYHTLNGEIVMPSAPFQTDFEEKLSDKLKSWRLVG